MNSALRCRYQQWDIIQEAVIDEEVAQWMDDSEKVKKLAGYDWILEQFKISCV